MTGRLGDRRAVELWRYSGAGAAAWQRVFDAVIQALKHADIPVAGADRLKLTEHIAIIDLMNLADALLLPHGRSGARRGAEKPAVRSGPTTICFKLAWQRTGSLRSGAGPNTTRSRTNCKARFAAVAGLRGNANAASPARRRFRFMRGYWVETAAARAF